MAVFIAPVAAVGVGGAYVLAFTKVHSLAANFTAQKLYGEEKEAYPWPFWKSWFSQQPLQNDSTVSGKIGALAIFGASFWLQKRLMFRALGSQAKVPENSSKIKNTGQFVKLIGPRWIFLPRTNEKVHHVLEGVPYPLNAL